MFKFLGRVIFFHNSFQGRVIEEGSSLWIASFACLTRKFLLIERYESKLCSMLSFRVHNF
ncbi:hypothetical protein Sjap_017462 [Stephania japonica]|uniref:Uncharacterized protein n=1 Tax=Stephania japonica TaxID=461633 RepID=A0AAP0NIB5_9MAGN